MTAMQTIRTSVPPEVFAELDHQAEQAGVSMAMLVRQVLTAHTASTQPPEVTVEAWLRFRKWVTSHPEAIAGYTGERQWNVAANRSAVVAHATAHGYTPDPG